MSYTGVIQHLRAKELYTAINLLTKDPSKIVLISCDQSSILKIRIVKE